MKYKNVPNTFQGKSFRSILERDRYRELLLLKAAKLVKDIQTEVPYRLDVNGIHITDYFADFDYMELVGKSWVHRVEDTKCYATITPLFTIKKRLMLACHNIEVIIRVREKGTKGTVEYKKAIPSRPVQSRVKPSDAKPKKTPVECHKEHLKVIKHAVR